MINKTDLSKYNNNWYNPGSSMKRVFWYLINSIIFKSALLPFNRIKIILLRLFGAKIGNNVVIKPCVNIKYPWFLNIGNNCWIGENVWIDNLAMVNIGNNVCLSQGVILLIGNHNYSKSTFDLIVKPIILEDGVWIGANSVVCGGVTCHSHSVLSVSSVASKDLEAFGVYQGNPCIKIKIREIID